ARPDGGRFRPLVQATCPDDRKRARGPDDRGPPRAHAGPRRGRPAIRSEGCTVTMTILITGANKGLGHEAARRLAAAGHEVWGAARDPQRGRAAAEEVGARPLVLDVTDDESVRAAAATVADATGGVLDVLINNAGISGGPVPAADLTAETMHEVYD